MRTLYQHGFSTLKKLVVQMSPLCAQLTRPSVDGLCQLLPASARAGLGSSPAAFVLLCCLDRASSSTGPSHPLCTVFTVLTGHEPISGVVASLFLLSREWILVWARACSLACGPRSIQVCQLSRSYQGFLVSTVGNLKNWRNTVLRGCESLRTEHILRGVCMLECPR